MLRRIAVGRLTAAKLPARILPFALQQAVTHLSQRVAVLRHQRSYFVDEPAKQTPPPAQNPSASATPPPALDAHKPSDAPTTNASSPTPKPTGFGVTQAPPAEKRGILQRLFSRKSKSDKNTEEDLDWLKLPPRAAKWRRWVLAALAFLAMDQLVAVLIMSDETTQANFYKYLMDNAIDVEDNSGTALHGLRAGILEYLCSLPTQLPGLQKAGLVTWLRGILYRSVEYDNPEAEGYAFEVINCILQNGDDDVRREVISVLNLQRVYHHLQLESDFNLTALHLLCTLASIPQTRGQIATESELLFFLSEELGSDDDPGYVDWNRRMAHLYMNVLDTEEFYKAYPIEKIVQTLLPRLLHLTEMSKDEYTVDFTLRALANLAHRLKGLPIILPQNALDYSAKEYEAAVSMHSMYPLESAYEGLTWTRFGAVLSDSFSAGVLGLGWGTLRGWGRMVRNYRQVHGKGHLPGPGVWFLTLKRAAPRAALGAMIINTLMNAGPVPVTAFVEKWPKERNTQRMLVQSANYWATIFGCYYAATKMPFSLAPALYNFTIKSPSDDYK